jgi:dihydroorotate dehydrogenase electron transfer subunit
MRTGDASVVQTYVPWEHIVGVTIQAIDLGRVMPGQFVLCSPRFATLSVIPQAWMVTSQNEHEKTFDVLFRRSGDDRGLPLTARVGDSLTVTGPVGKPFVIESRTRRALLIDQGSNQAPLLQLVQRLIDLGIEITYLAASDAVPPWVLPPEIEYLPVSLSNQTGVKSMFSAVDDLAPWADAMYISVDSMQLVAITNVLRRRLLRLRRGFAQVLMSPGLVPCGLGACDMCNLGTRDGMKRLCKDGLVFDLLSLV